jgi:hypothetical protein
VLTWTATVPISRGAIELRENLTEGQSISNYTIEFCAPSSAGTRDAPVCNGLYVQLHPLHNGPQLTIGNRRLHFWTNVSVGGIRVTVSTLRLQSGFAPPSVRSLAVFDWSDPALDPLLAGILALE